MTGKGHALLIPMVGRSNSPSGFALTQVMLKSYVTVAASDTTVNMRRSSAWQTGKKDKESAILYYMTTSMSNK
jgi:hypothetical protein